MSGQVTELSGGRLTQSQPADAQVHRVSAMPTYRAGIERFGWKSCWWADAGLARAPLPYERKDLIST